jgi:hypothetical protein
LQDEPQGLVLMFNSRVLCATHRSDHRLKSIRRMA